MQARVERERERYPERSRTFRIAWVSAGVILVLAGLAMVIFPGPALVVIPIGLAMLSLQFAWAESLLDKGLEGGKAAQKVAAESSTLQRILAGAALACAAVAAVVAAVLVLG